MSSSPNLRSERELTQRSDDVMSVKGRNKKRVTKSDTSLASIIYNKKPILKPGVKKRDLLTKSITELDATPIITFFIPVTVSVVLVLVSIAFLPFFSTSIDYTTLVPGVTLPIESEESSTAGKTLSAIIFAAILIGVMFVMTTCIACAMVRGWFGGLNALFTLSIALSLTLLSSVYLYIALNTYNIPFDAITAFLLIWNYVVIGLIVLRTQFSPKLLERAYHILLSAATALMVIKILPTWTAWVVMFLITLLDIYEVFRGPLKTIIEAEDNSNRVYLPVYSAIVRVMAEKSGRRKRSESYSESDSEDKDGFEMGLGDIVFYSVLIGKSYVACNLLSAVICFIGVLFGMIVTSALLAYLDKAVPALPVSIYLGLIFHFSAVWFITPFNGRLISRQIFI